MTQELARGDSGISSFVSVQSALVMYPITVVVGGCKPLLSVSPFEDAIGQRDWNQVTFKGHFLILLVAQTVVK
jgi:hypothetical protein